MKAWLWHHFDSLRSTLVRFGRAPLASLFNIGVIGIALALPAGLYVGLANLQNSARELASDPQLSLFLALDAGRAEAAEIEGRLKRHSGVRAYRYVSVHVFVREYIDEKWDLWPWYPHFKADKYGG